jgi:hypothetical protein
VPTAEIAECKTIYYGIKQTKWNRIYIKIIFLLLGGEFRKVLPDGTLIY